MPRKIGLLFTFFTFVLICILCLNSCNREECIHEYSPTVTKDATCTTEGSVDYKCSLCGECYTEAIPALGHDEIVHEERLPTCTEVGWNAYVSCSRCEYTTYSEKPIVAHTETLDAAKAPTCTETGLTEGSHCSSCNKIIKPQKEISAIGHSFGDWYIFKAPSESENGEERRNCENCDAYESNVIEALPHVHSRWPEITLDMVAPTCTESGLTEGKMCSGCGAVLIAQEIVLPLKHNEIHCNAKEPTCTEVGWNAYVYCSRCDYTTYEEKAMLGHDVQHHEAKEATCTNIGWYAYEDCLRCDYTTYEEKAMLDHEYGTEYSYDEIYHYHECTCGARKDEGKHIHPESSSPLLDEACTVCGYIIAEAVGISFKTLEFDGNIAYLKLSNDTEFFSFINEISSKGGAKYLVSTNISATELIPSKTVELGVGDNTFYIVEFIEDEPTKIYTVHIRRKPIYEVCFNTAGGTPVSTRFVEEDATVSAPEAPSRSGYVFAGWNYDFTKPVTNDITIEAKWIADGDTKYTVEHYFENSAGVYELATLETQVLFGASGTDVTLTAKEFENYILNSEKSTLSGRIAGDGSLVLKAFYDRIACKITVVSDNEKAGVLSGGGYYDFGNTVTLYAIANPGYSFIGWFDGDNILCDAETFTFSAEQSISILAKWSANSYTEYKVEYYFESLSGGEYILDEAKTDIHFAPTDSFISTNIKNFDGFSFNSEISVTSGNVSGEGTLVLKLYYKRDVFTVTVSKDNTNAGNVSGGGEYAYGETVTIAAITKPGYTFLGWFDGENNVCENLTFSFIAERSCAYEARWSANATTPYRVEYYFEDQSGGTYTLQSDKTETLFGVTGTAITLEPKIFSHFTYNENNSLISGSIAGDGSLILKVYYLREWYSVINSNREFGSVSCEETYIYGDRVSVTSTPNIGYNFLGWYVNNTLVCTDRTYEFVIESDVEARFKLDEGMDPFDFTLNESECIIIGVKDKSVTEVVIPDYVTAIAKSAFLDCKNLENIVIPEGVLSIGDYAFSGCESLNSVVISSSVAYIGKGAFSHFSGITVHENNSVYTSVDGSLYTKDGKTVMRYAVGKSDENFAIPEGVVTVGEDAFSDSTLKSVFIPSSVRVIADYAFALSSSLQSVVFAEECALLSFGEYAFKDCVSLDTIVIFASVETIEANAFVGCINLSIFCEINERPTVWDSDWNSENCPVNWGYTREETIPEGLVWKETEDGIEITDYQGDRTVLEIPLTINGIYVTKIGNGAFETCSNLNTVIIPKTVISIERYAFSDCINLKSVVFEEKSQLLSVGAGAFCNCIALREIILPEGFTYIGDFAFEGCTDLVKVGIPTSVTNIGVCAFYDCVSLESVFIPSGVEQLAYATFIYCSSLKTVTFESESCLNKISASVFYGCSALTEMFVPENVSVIESYAFYGCSNLKNITVHQNNSAYKDVDGNLYQKDGKILIQYASGKGDKHFIIPDGVTIIDNNAFYNAVSLEKVFIPDSVTCIGDKAFSECSKLKSIVITDNVTSIGSNAFYKCSVLKLYCEAESKPDTWEANWNYSDCPVVWGYKNIGVGDGEIIITPPDNFD